MPRSMDGNGSYLPGEVTSREGRLETTIAQLESELAELRAVEAEFRAMFQAMQDAVMVLDGDGRFLKVAPTAPDLLFAPAEELLGRTIHELFAQDKADYLVTKIREALAARQVVVVEYNLPIRGVELFFLGSISPMSEDTVIIVSRDVTQIRRAEQRERALQEEIIRAQEVALAELSTPLVPISDEIVAMPLVGHLDESRMQRVMGAMLEGVQARGTRYAILDVTGVPVVDAVVAQALVSVARAVQLLGSEVILTGIRPEVARTLASMDTHIGDILTRSTLKDAITLALGRSRPTRWSSAEAFRRK
jgi:PAS domain S-box-containing protein